MDIDKCLKEEEHVLVQKGKFAARFSHLCRYALYTPGITWNALTVYYFETFVSSLKFVKVSTHGWDYVTPTDYTFFRDFCLLFSVPAGFDISVVHWPPKYYLLWNKRHCKAALHIYLMLCYRFLPTNFYQLWHLWQRCVLTKCLPPSSGASLIGS